MSHVVRVKLPFAVRLLLSVGTLAAVAAVCLPARADDSIDVAVDRAKVMHMSRPAGIVIVGNPAIADATVQDNQTLIITGKSFGSTNLIVLDTNGQSIAEDILTVTQPDDDVVTVYRRDNRQTYSCTPDCSPTLAIGDTANAFDSVNSQIQAHSDLSAKQQ